VDADLNHVLPAKVKEPSMRLGRPISGLERRGEDMDLPNVSMAQVHA
jgi:hypothetical protein